LSEIDETKSLPNPPLFDFCQAFSDFPNFRNAVAEREDDALEFAKRWQTTWGRVDGRGGMGYGAIPSI
jgi:hypothetical protein